MGMITPSAHQLWSPGGAAAVVCRNHPCATELLRLITVPPCLPASKSWSPSSGCTRVSLQFYLTSSQTEGALMSQHGHNYGPWPRVCILWVRHAPKVQLRQKRNRHILNSDKTRALAHLQILIKKSIHKVIIIDTAFQHTISKMFSVNWPYFVLTKTLSTGLSFSLVIYKKLGSYHTWPDKKKKLNKLKINVFLEDSPMFMSYECHIQEACQVHRAKIQTGSPHASGRGRRDACEMCSRLLYNKESQSPTVGYSWRSFQTEAVSEVKC